MRARARARARALIPGVPGVLTFVAFSFTFVLSMLPHVVIVRDGRYSALRAPSQEPSRSDLCDRLMIAVSIKRSRTRAVEAR